MQMGMPHGLRDRYSKEMRSSVYLWMCGCQGEGMCLVVGPGILGACYLTMFNIYIIHYRKGCKINKRECMSVP